MAIVLVTGGAGFIGSHIAEELLRKGDRVRVLDNLSTGKRSNLEFLESLGGDLEIVEGDVADAGDARAGVRGVEVVFHQAALGSVPKSVEDPESFHHSNLTGTLSILMASREAGVRAFVNAASSSAYGDTPVLPKTETMAANPMSPYAATKLGQEHYTRAFAECYGVRSVSLRYFNVFGARQDPDSQYAAVIPRFFRALLRGEPPIIYGDGGQTRDFTYVKDVVDANLRAAAFKGASGQVFNIAGGKAVTIGDLAVKIGALLGSTISPRHEPARTGDILHSLADISAARSELGFEPRTSLDEGLAEALLWYKKHLS